MTDHVDAKAAETPRSPHRDALIDEMFSPPDSLLQVLRRRLTAGELVAARDRRVGAGMIGARAAGLVFADALLARATSSFTFAVERDDSIFIGSDVSIAFRATGDVPEDIARQLETVSDRWSETPLIVRPSLPFGAPPSSMCHSIFCLNRGSRDNRSRELLGAVRHIFTDAATLSDAPAALIVSRVHGRTCGTAFFPDLSGVALSFNPYAWNEYIDPKAGAARLVVGLGTHFAKGAEDFSRLVSLNAPERRPEADFDEIRKSSQRRVDYLDLSAGQVATEYFMDMARQPDGMPVNLLSTPDESPHPVTGKTMPILTLEPLVNHGSFIKDLREMLRLLGEAFDHPVELEFTALLAPNGHHTLRVHGCKPWDKLRPARDRIPMAQLLDKNLLFEVHGPVIGRGRVIPVRHIIHVPSAAYAHLPMQDRYEIARTIGRIQRKLEDGALMLIGPGRWGTTTPSLGIPVSFAEINRASVMVEIAEMHEHLTPELSLATHCFNELVAANMLYVAVQPGRERNTFHADLLAAAPNRLEALVPAAARLCDAIRVIDATTLTAGRGLTLYADSWRRQALCYIGQPPDLNPPGNAI